MAKEKERKSARIYYVKEGKTAKEIAILLNVTEKTIGKWVDAGSWKKARASFLFSAKNRISNIEEIISTKAERTLRLEKDLVQAESEKNLDKMEDIRGEMNSIADEVSKWNKTLTNLDKENKVNLEVYLYVMENLFKDLHNKHPKIFLKLIDFQEQHVNKISNEL